MVCPNFVVIFRDTQTGEIISTLIGHTDTVCTLAVTATGELVSGSWDKTAKVWEGGNCKVSIEGHTQGVWAVLGLPDGNIATASADQTIKIWNSSGKIVKTLEKKHSDCVRDLAIFSDKGFLSVGNDGYSFIATNDQNCKFMEF